MTMPIQFNTLEYARMLEAAGIPTDQAEAHAQALSEAMANCSVVAPSDMVILRSELLARMDLLRHELYARMDLLKHELHARIDAIKQELNYRIDTLELQMNARFDALEAKWDARFASLELKLQALEIKFDGKFRLLYWMFGALIALNGAILVKLFN